MRQLLVQLPRLLSELCSTLRGEDLARAAARASRGARAYATDRWRQGYLIDELYLELNLLRRCTQSRVREFFACSGMRDHQIAAHDVVDDFFGKLIHSAIWQLQSQQSRRTTDALVQQKRVRDRLRVAAQAAGLGIFEWDIARDTAVWENERMYEITGQPIRKGPLSGNAFFDRLVHSNDARRIREAFSHAASTGEPLRETLVIKKVDSGEPRTVEISGQLTSAEAGSSVIIGTLADVTVRAHADATLRKANERKDVLLATLAHELRNPLAPVRTAAQLIKESGSTAQELRWIREVIERQTSHLSHLIDDLLDVSRISTGKIQLHLEVFDIRDAIRRALEITAPAAALKHHRVDFIGDDCAGAYVRGDLTRITQVMSNLLDNAIKYTTVDGHVRVTMLCNAGIASICVEDNGIGMDSELIPALFEVFEQAAPSGQGEAAGLGIGLAVARSLVQMHGGTVFAESDGPGSGSRFTVQLPLSDPPTCATKTDHVASEKDGRTLRVLVVDDNQDAATSLAIILSDMEVRTAFTGREAVEVAHAFRPQAVILDLGLPDLSGYEVARQIRAFGGSYRTCLIALTGYGQPEDRQRTREAGFDHHLVKPASPDSILSILAKI